MPPKVKFDREIILKAALDIINEKGFKEISSRNIAKRINSSTITIYSHFKTIDNLKREAILKIKDILVEYTKNEYTERPFLNIGMGMAIFAREHPNYFKIFFLESNKYNDEVKQFLDEAFVLMGNDKRFTSLPSKAKKRLLNRMFIFTHGLASLICVGLINKNDNKYIKELLIDVGSAVINKIISEENRTI